METGSGGLRDYHLSNEAKAAKIFGDMVGKSDYSPEDLAEYKSDLARYLRSNEVKVATLQVGQDPVGGYLVLVPTGCFRMLDFQAWKADRQILEIDSDW